jgi:colicin import membrane protein
LTRAAVIGADATQCGTHDDRSEVEQARARAAKAKKAAAKRIAAKRAAAAERAAAARAAAKRKAAKARARIAAREAASSGAFLPPVAPLAADVSSSVDRRRPSPPSLR